ncbi:HET-domain-containing protein, partial [Trematosphaeria pertusa]
RHLEEFFGQNIPPYAILSHTWEEQELSFKEYYNPKAHLRHPKSAAKLFRTCERAIQDGYEFVWVDSCCIDKSSSAELSEAINSMFKWYGAARRCYAYLSDFDFDELRGDDQPIAASLNAKRVLSKCRWFYRGWTLQELLAPRDVWFFDCHWRYFGSRLQISSILSEITTIPEPVFKTTMSRRYSEYSIAQRMSWAAGRQTTREEDIAYCLFGIFHVNLPLLYGEGGERAFIRLQEEIMKESNDLTLFAWSSEGEQCCRGLLARSPREFASAGDIHSKTDVNKNPEFTLTNKGLRIETSI